MSGPVRSVLRQSASMDDYTRDRRNSVRFADQAAPSQALETFQQLAIQQQHPNLQQQQQQQAGAVLRSPLQVPQQQQQSHQGYYPCPSMTATASQLGNPQVGYNHASNNASASNVSANNNGATGAMQQQPQAAPGSPPQVSPLSPSQLSSFALQIAAQQQQQQQPVQQQQFVFQGTSNQQQQPVLSPTLTSTHSPQVMFNYSAQQPQHVVPQNGWQQTQQQQQQQTSAPIFVKNNDQFSPLSIANTDDPKWHKWVELINQYWNEMAALDEQSRFQMICNLSILAAEKE